MSNAELFVTIGIVGALLLIAFVSVTVLGSTRRVSGQTLPSPPPTSPPPDLGVASAARAPQPSDQAVLRAREREAIRAASLEEEWWYSVLLEYAAESVIVWDLDGSGIIFWNPAAEKLYGYGREEVLGKVTHTLLKTKLVTNISDLEEAIARGGNWTGELRHTTRDGRQIRVSARLVLLPNQDGRRLVAEMNTEFAGVPKLIEADPTST